jgi:HK97 family phage major capsid protein
MVYQRGTMAKSVELKQERATLIADAKRMLDLVEKDNRAFTDQEEDTYNSITQKAESLRDEITKAERREWVESAEVENKRIERKIKPLVVRTAEQSGNLNRAYLDWFRAGFTRISDESRENAALCGVDLHSRDLHICQQTRDITKTTGADWVPEEFYNQVNDKLLTMGSLFSLANKIPTNTGNVITVPLSDDSSNKAVITSEGNDYNETDPTPDKIALNAYKYTTSVQVSREMLEDNSFPLEQYIVSALGTRLSRGIETHLAIGDGTGEPQGVCVGAADATTNETGLTYELLVDIYTSVDPLYLSGGNIGWMMSMSTFGAVLKLTDANFRPLVWTSNDSLKSGVMGTLLGYPIYIHPDFDSIPGSGAATPIVFGNFSHYWVRTVNNIYFQRLSELNAKKGLVDFLVDYRLDGKIVSAGSPLVAWNLT